MKANDVKEIAAGHGIKVGKMKKSEIIRAIQRAEQNNDCFETGQISHCGQSGCLWREDCN